ncbi:MAG: rRNA pseudouridine synthase [Deltaproteobacteria bacterium]|nr:rRNA pseudouridine synthase [Deltaproteobacteria bacterium]
MRLQKFLAHAGACSRRTGEKWVAEGRVSVNGKVVTTPGTVVDPEADEIRLDGKRLTIPRDNLTIALNKPEGFVSSCHQPQERTVLELVDTPRRLYPIGRLDKDSTGLLLLTDNGMLHHQLSHPSFNHEKEYIVKTARPVSDKDLERLARPMNILGKKTRPARVKRRGRDTFSIILKEGMNRQVRRMVGKTGHRVVSLHRVRMGSIRLGNLGPGQWRKLSEKEVSGLLARPSAKKTDGTA